MPPFAIEHTYTTLEIIAIGAKPCWEMFCLPVPPECQSIKKNKKIKTQSLLAFLNYLTSAGLYYSDQSMMFVTLMRLVPFSIKTITAYQLAYHTEVLPCT